MKWSPIASILGGILVVVSVAGCSPDTSRRGPGPGTPDPDVGLLDIGEDVDPGGPDDTGGQGPDTSTGDPDTSTGEPDATAQCTSRTQCGAG